MRQQKFLEKRGVKVDYAPFQQASLMNEVFIPGQVQVVQAGALGLMTAMALDVPTVAVAVYPAQRQAFMVHPKSPIRSLQDLKDQAALGRPAVIGVALGTSQHLGLILAAQAIDLQEGRDYVTINGIAPDLITMPDGLDVVVIFEPNVMLMEEFLGNARVIDLTDNYAVFSGYSYMRGEIEEGAPDVVQAYVDALTEAELYARLNPEESITAFAADESQRGRDPELIKRDVTAHVLNPTPTRHYPFKNADGFWISLESFQANILADAGILHRTLSEGDFDRVLRPEFLANTYEKLGWAVPRKPPFLPADWAGVIGQPPYPPYGLAVMGKQDFPEPSDLVREWKYGGKLYRPQ